MELSKQRLRMSKYISMGQCLPPSPPYTADQQQSFYIQKTPSQDSQFIWLVKLCTPTQTSLKFELSFWAIRARPKFSPSEGSRSGVCNHNMLQHQPELEDTQVPWTFKLTWPFKLHYFYDLHNTRSSQGCSASKYEPVVFKLFSRNSILFFPKETAHW